MRFARFLLLFVAVGFSSVRLAAASDEFTYFHEGVLGTSLELRIKADSSEAAQRGETAVLREIDRLAAIFSGYDAGSEFSQWKSKVAGPGRISRELFEVLNASDVWRVRSGGAFDPRVEALSQLWNECARANRTPSADELSEVKDLMRRESWKLDQSSQTAQRLTNCPITLNAIAKGFIVERATEVALRDVPGLRGILLNVGGDLRVGGEMDRPLGIAPPRGDSESAEPIATLQVKDRSVATSGNSQRGLRIKGKWFSHIFNPKTGMPVEETVSATVVARRGADADALATIFNVMPVKESLGLADSLEDVACLLVSRDGRISKSRNWIKYETQAIAVLGSAAHQTAANSKDAKESAKGWGQDNELVVNFEISRPEGNTARYRRPYVVVWVEDKEGHPVRTISLWVSLGGAGPDRWLPDLSRWYRDDQAQAIAEKKSMVFTIARPTRATGKYTVIWDGKDDQGKPADPGDYTVFIETAREHGTHQLIQKPIKIGTQPFKEELKGNVEINSASLEFRRKTAEK